MPKYLVRGNYTAEGPKGLMKDGGSGRKTAVTKAVESLGGKVEAFYFALGEHDIFVIAELPDAVAATSVALAAVATGAVTLDTVHLLTPEDVDAAIKKTVNYRSPGQQD
jgi:uncharacterized protein with GYD domain